MNNGGFIISLDYELLWGLTGHSREYLEKYSYNIKNATTALRQILSIGSKYGIKFTIAHVGGMALRQYADLQRITPPHQDLHI